MRWKSWRFFFSNENCREIIHTVYIQYIYMWHPNMVKCVKQSESVIKLFQNILFMNMWRERDGNLEVQILCRSGHLVPKVFECLLYSSDNWHLIIHNLEDANEETLYSHQYEGNDLKVIDWNYISSVNNRL